MAERLNLEMLGRLVLSASKVDGDERERDPFLMEDDTHALGASGHGDAV